MKKLIIIIALVTFISGFSQKKITITNLTNSPMKIYGIRTKPASGTYPYCYGFSFALYAGQSYTLVNNLSTTKFPFYSSPTSLPPVISNLNWTRVNSATSSLVNQTGVNLWNNIFASSQNFNFLDFSIGTITGVGGVAGSIGVSTLNGQILGNGWEAYCDVYPATPGNPIAETTITFINP